MYFVSVSVFVYTFTPILFETISLFNQKTPLLLLAESSKGYLKAEVDSDSCETLLTLYLEVVAKN